MTLSIADRLQRLEDAEAIQDVLMDYARTLDARDMESYSALFAREGEWTGPYVGTARGPAAIFRLMQNNLGPAPAGSNHVISNIVVKVDGDRAEAQSRWTYMIPAEGGAPRPAICGRYEDILVREDGAWRFLKREVLGDISIPA